MADESSHRGEPRVFRHSPLEIFLLAIILIGLAFMVKTIFATPEQSTSRLASSVANLQQKVMEISESLQQKQAAGQGGQADVSVEVKRLQEAVRGLEERMEQLQNEIEEQRRKQEEATKLLNQRIENYYQAVEQRLSVLEGSGSQGKQSAER